MRLFILTVLALKATGTILVDAFGILSQSRTFSIIVKKHNNYFPTKPVPTSLFLSQQQSEEDSTEKASVSFDEAGASLKDAEDLKRLQEMGDFDSNPNVCFILCYSKFIFVVFLIDIVCGICKQN